APEPRHHQRDSDHHGDHPHHQPEGRTGHEAALQRSRSLEDPDHSRNHERDTEQPRRRPHDRSSLHSDRGTSRVPVAFHVATTTAPGRGRLRRKNSSVISTTIGGELPTVTRNLFATPATFAT